MNHRIRELRKALKLTQVQLGDILHIQGSAVSKIESGENSLTDANLAAIYRVLNVNPLWLETGEGEMFVEPTREEEISSFLADVQIDGGFKAKFIAGLAALDTADWENLKAIFEKMHKKMADED